MHKIFCIGAALIDESFMCRENPVNGTSNPAVFNRSAGGVSLNVAHHLARLGNDVSLVTHFGTDPDGNWLMEKCRNAGIDISHSIVNELATGRYAAIMGTDSTRSKAGGWPMAMSSGMDPRPSTSPGILHRP